MNCTYHLNSTGENNVYLNLAAEDVYDIDNRYIKLNDKSKKYHIIELIFYTFEMILQAALIASLMWDYGITDAMTKAVAVALIFNAYHIMIYVLMKQIQNLSTKWKIKAMISHCCFSAIVSIAIVTAEVFGTGNIIKE